VGSSAEQVLTPATLVLRPFSLGVLVSVQEVLHHPVLVFNAEQVPKIYLIYTLSYTVILMVTR